MKDDKRNEEIEIDLGEMFRVLLHYAWLLIICTVVGAVAGFAVSKFVITPKYESTTGIYIMARQNDTSTVTYSDTQLSTQLTKDYEELIVCRTVLEKVIAKCGLSDSYESLKGRVDVENTSNTRIIYITVKDTDPIMAMNIANNIREVASEHITAVTDTEAVTVVDEANLPTEPSEPSVKKWTVLAALVGLILSAGFIIIRYLVDDTIKTSDDVENYLGLSTLAVIPIMEGINDNGLKEKNKSKIMKNKGEDKSSGHSGSHSSGNRNSSGSGSGNSSGGSFGSGSGSGLGSNSGNGSGSGSSLGSTPRRVVKRRQPDDNGGIEEVDLDNQ